MRIFLWGSSTLRRGDREANVPRVYHDFAACALSCSAPAPTMNYMPNMAHIHTATHTLSDM